MRASLYLLLLTIAGTSGCETPSETAEVLGSFDLVAFDGQGLPVQVSELTMNAMKCTRSLSSSTLELAGGTYMLAATLVEDCEDGSTVEDTRSEAGVYELNGHELQFTPEGDHWAPAPNTAIIENDTLRTSLNGVPAVYARN